jgi:signal transduction histidine kinase
MMQQSIRVLLVEDSPTDLDMLQRTFARLGLPQDWQILAVETLADAIALHPSDAAIATDASLFDVVLLDLGLPDAKGLETLTRFRAAVPDVPVVVLTGLDDEEMAFKAIEAGAQDYLVKDQVSIQWLKRTLRFAMERQQSLSQLQRSEAQSRAALAAERELHELKTRFIGMVSHEFRNPLGVIQNAAELLRMRLDQTIKPKEADLLQKIDRASDQLISLMNDVLTFSRLQAQSDYASSATELDLAAFCQELIETFRFQLSPPPLIDFQPSGDLTLIHTDRNLLNYILTNLLSNAIKYSPQGSVIDFVVQVDAQQLTFRVVDRGIGIPAAELHRILGSFYRASNVDQVSGTGLGLAVVKHCVDALNGRLAINSQIAQGTTVIVILPLIAAPGGIRSSLKWV